MSDQIQTKRRSKNEKATGRKALAAQIVVDLQPLSEAIETLEPNDQNARSHDEANIAAIAASLREFGQRKPIVVNRHGRVIEAGNAVYLAAKSLGWTHLAVVWVEDDPKAAAGFALADNRTAELADWDQLRLETLLAEMAEDGESAELYQELLLADLRQRDVGEDSAEVAGQDAPIPEKWSLVVECADEADQHALYERLTEEGRTCRPLTL